MLDAIIDFFAELFSDATSSARSRYRRRANAPRHARTSWRPMLDPSASEQKPRRFVNKY